MHLERKFEPFNSQTINAEFRTVPVEDRIRLMFAMQNFQDGIDGGYVVKSYGSGLQMIKATNHSSGRGLFFYSHVVNGVQICRLVLVYKKEATEVPAHVLATARRRMEQSR